MALISTILSSVIGVVVGAAAAYYRGITEAVLDARDRRDAVAAHAASAARLLQDAA